MGAMRLPRKKRKWPTARGGKVYTAKGRNCILAGWHVVIAYLCAELPQKQRDALVSAQKVPLLSTNLALRNRTSFQKLNTSAVYARGCYHTRVGLDLAAGMAVTNARGAYRRPHDEGALSARRASSTCWAALNGSKRPLKRWSARFAPKWLERSLQGASIGRATSPRSRSTAGPTVTPRNTTPCSMPSGVKAARLPAK